MAPQPDIHPITTLTRLYGAETAHALRAAFSGTSLYVPRAPGADHAISKAIGHAKALALGAECGGVLFSIPKGTTFRDRLRELVAEGLLNREIALRMGVTERHVYSQRRRYGLRGCDLVAKEAGK